MRQSTGRLIRSFDVKLKQTAVTVDGSTAETVHFGRDRSVNFDAALSSMTEFSKRNFFQSSSELNSQ